MPRISSFVSRVRLLSLCLFLAPALVAGCSSERMARSPSDITNVVLRPIYGQGEEKTMYLGGYAGADYQNGGR